ncbi:MAG: antitoxin family protein [Pirellulaceae bacterium]|nr:antitoxin family protein [Pirellulaceae bacterium]
MTHNVEATYDNGVLRLAHPVPLAPNERVRVTIESQGSAIVEAFGILGWNGDHETLRSLAEDPEFQSQETA